MIRRWLPPFVLFWVAFAVRTPLPAQSMFEWTLPRGFAAPAVPADNPMSAAKVELGRHLFYDTRLSGNGKQACATCHVQSLAFTDGRPVSIGSTGQAHPRGSMGLVNVAYASVLTWASPTLTRLEDQALVPMYGDQPVELGLDDSDKWLEPLAADRTYQRLFAEAFSRGAASVTRDNVVKAIATFERSIVSLRSSYDRYHFDRDDSAISESAKRGEVLFHSRPLSCFRCHGGAHFSNVMGTEAGSMPPAFHNTGLYNLPGPISYPAENTGLHSATGNPTDVGRFKAPSLRNIAVTAPYMHDGSIATLEEAIDHYAAGGRTLTSGRYQGVGRDNPNKTPLIRGFMITPAERADLVAFLQSLTDHELLTDRRFANPWPAPSRTEQEPPTVAAAANLNFALTEIADQFARDSGKRVEVVFGASGTLTRQIRDGAPFELFLAADEEFPNQLTAAGLTRDAGVVYAAGRLVIFAPKGSALAVDERLEGLARLLKSGGVSRFAIANPDVAPYGKAAEAVLRKRGLWDAIRAQLVLGDSIAQAAQFATTGNAIGGLLAYSLVLGPGFADRGSYAVIPEADHSPLRQRMVLLKNATPTAAEFYTYVQAAAARAIFKKHGYGVPQ